MGDLIKLFCGFLINQSEIVMRLLDLNFPGLFYKKAAPLLCKNLTAPILPCDGRSSMCLVIRRDHCYICSVLRSNVPCYKTVVGDH